MLPATATKSGNPGAKVNSLICLRFSTNVCFSLSCGKTVEDKTPQLKVSGVGAHFDTDETLRQNKRAVEKCGSKKAIFKPLSAQGSPFETFHFSLLTFPSWDKQDDSSKNEEADGRLSAFSTIYSKTCITMLPPPCSVSEGSIGKPSSPLVK